MLGLPAMPGPITLRTARREDVAAIVRLLADDHLGAGREAVSDPPPTAYFAAFERVDADPRNLLAVAEDAGGKVVGTLQMTFIPGLSNQGAELALIEAVRIDFQPARPGSWPGDDRLGARRGAAARLPLR